MGSAGARSVMSYPASENPNLVRYLSGGVGRKGKADMAVERAPAGGCQGQYRRDQGKAAMEVERATEG